MNKVIFLSILLYLVLINPVKAQNHTFINVTSQMGIYGQTGLGHSVGWCDIDNDLDPDLAISNQDGTGFWLYRNDSLQFTNITSSAGLGGLGAYKILWAELTGDQFTDLILNGNFYKNNGDGTFLNITGGSGISGYCYSSADFNHDGLNDLVRLSPEVSVLYNDGDNTFTPVLIENNSYWVLTCFDYNLDGYLDIYLGTYGNNPNKLYKNLGDGTFQNATAVSNTGYSGAAHGLTSGDYNNDGFPDLYIGSYGNLSCKLLQNQGDGTFTDVTSGSGASGHNDTRTTSFIDYNNDGFLDIFSSHHNFYSYSNTLLRNNGDGTFTNVAPQMGISGEWIGDYFGVGWGDFNKDGATDLFAAGHIDKYRLFRNDNCPGNFLNLSLSGTGSTYNAVGAKVSLWSEGDQITRWVMGGEGKHDFSSFNLKFGLGDKTMIDSLIIYWPGGIEEKLYNLESNQFLTITEGALPLSLLMSPNSFICYGDSIQISGEVTGGTGNYNFLWSPSAGLSNPAISNPIAFPDTTTTYTLTVDDGTNTISDSVIIIVFGNLNPEIIAMPNDTTGINDTIILGFDEGYLVYFWQDGSTDSTFTATNNSGPNGGAQVYWVEVTGAAGCIGSDTISVWFLPLTKMNDNKPDILFEVYPNPAKDKIRISLGNVTGDVDVQILTTNGNMVYKSSLKSAGHKSIEIIDISLLPKGVYLIRIKSQGEKKSEIKKFIKY